MARLCTTVPHPHHHHTLCCDNTHTQLPQTQPCSHKAHNFMRHEARQLNCRAAPDKLRAPHSELRHFAAERYIKCTDHRIARVFKNKLNTPQSRSSTGTLVPSTPQPHPHICLSPHPQSRHPCCDGKGWIHPATKATTHTNSATPHYGLHHTSPTDLSPPA